MDFDYLIFRFKEIFWNLFDKNVPPSEFLEIPYEVEFNYKSLFPLIGYGFLSLTFLLWIGILYPFNLFNEVWEFNAITQLLDTVPYQFIGFGLIFFTRAGSLIHQNEKNLLKFLYWLVLLLAISYFLLIPLIIGDTNRLINNELKVLNNQKQNQEIEVNFFENRLNQIGDQDLIKYYQNRLLLEQNKNEIEEKNKLKTISASTIRYSLLQEFKSNQFQFLSIKEKDFQINKKARIKASIIYTLTAIIDGFIMFKIFRFSRWINRID